jgi:hypothetical protein
MHTLLQLDKEITAAARKLAAATRTRCPVRIEEARQALERLVQKQRQLLTAHPR